MCGIFGFIARRGAACDRARFQGALTRLFKLSEPRGREASGLVIANNGTAQVVKRGSSPSRMLRSRDYGMFLDANLTALAFTISSLNLNLAAWRWLGLRGGVLLGGAGPGLPNSLDSGGRH